MYETTERSFSTQEIDAEIVRLARQKGALDEEIGRWLLLALRNGVHFKLGMASICEYAERRFGYSPRVTKEKLRVAQELRRLPRLKAELDSGGRSWSVVRELARVASPSNEAEWIAASAGKTVREVEQLVSGLKKGAPPTAPRDPLLMRKRMVVDFESEEHAVVLEAVEIMRRRLGPNTTLAQALRAMADGVLGQARKLESEPAYQSAVTICAVCRRTWRHAAGEAHEVPDCVGECAICDGELAGLVEINEPGADPAPAPAAHVGQPKGPEPLTHVGASDDTGPVTHVGQEPHEHRPATCVQTLIQLGGVRALLREASHTLGLSFSAVSPRVRGLVLARDQQRCSVPGCRNHLFIELHHLIPESKGGPHTPENLTVLCSTHHRLHHDGYLAIEGSPSEGLTFRHAGGTLYGGARAAAAA